MNPETAKRLIDGVKTLGFPVVMCLIFVAWEAGFLPSRTTAMATNLEKHMTQTADVAESFKKLSSAVERQTRVMQAVMCDRVQDPLLRATCMAPQ